MAGPRAEKIAMKREIIALLNKHKKLDRIRLICKLKLDTMFSAKVVVGLLQDMETVGIIKTVGPNLEFGDLGETKEVEVCQDLNTTAKNPEIGDGVSEPGTEKSLPVEKDSAAKETV